MKTYKIYSIKKNVLITTIIADNVNIHNNTYFIEKRTSTRISGSETIAMFPINKVFILVEPNNNNE